MPDDLHMLLYDFSGSIELPNADREDDGPAYSERSGEAEDSPRSARSTRRLLRNLDAEAEGISQKIEREIKRILPPSVTVQANIQFDEGSIVFTGVVAILKWAAPIVGDAAKKELGELVKLVIKRVISRYLTTSDVPPGMPPPFSGSITELNVTPQSSPPPDPPPITPVTLERTSPIFAGDKISAVIVLIVITGLILILQVITLLVHLR
jgi:hypothetical protein